MNGAHGGPVQPSHQKLGGAVYVMESIAFLDEHVVLGDLCRHTEQLTARFTRFSIAGNRPLRSFHFGLIELIYGGS